jgi:hypothetical protein
VQIVLAFGSVHFGRISKLFLAFVDLYYHEVDEEMQLVVVRMVI